MEWNTVTAASLCLAAIMALPTARADEPPANAGVLRLLNQPIPTRFSLREEPGTVESFTQPLSATTNAWAIGLTSSLILNLKHTDGTIDRLRNLRRLEILTLMRNESASVFFGINERGRLGLHFDASALMMPGEK